MVLAKRDAGAVVIALAFAFVMIAGVYAAKWIKTGLPPWRWDWERRRRALSVHGDATLRCDLDR